MDGIVADCDYDVALTDEGAGLRLRHKVSEAHQPVRQNDQRAFVHDFDLDRKSCVVRPRVEQINHHADRNHGVNRNLDPKCLNQEDTYGEDDASEKENRGDHKQQPRLLALLLVLGAFENHGNGRVCINGSEVSPDVDCKKDGNADRAYEKWPGKNI